jgi:hypothetical protein
VRTTYSAATVRLYHLDSTCEGGAATTLIYGTLAEALARAATEPEDVQDALFIATDNDVVSYIDLIEG